MNLVHEVKKVLLIISFGLLILVLMQSCSHTPKDSTLQKIYNQKLSGIVKVHIGCKNTCASGTGTVFYSEKADKIFVLTNSHVMYDNTEAHWIEFEDHTFFPVYVLKSLQKEGTSSDITIAGTSPKDKAELMKRALPISRNTVHPAPPKAGSRVYVIGAPRGVIFKATEGKALFSDGYIWINPEKSKLKILDLGLVMSVYVAPGSSGSCVWDANGNIVGMVWGERREDSEWAETDEDAFISSLSVNVSILRQLLIKQNLI